MKPLAILSLIVLALAAAASSAAWTPTREQLNDRRHHVMSNREGKCLHTWDLKQLPADLLPRQLRWKWGWWKALAETTHEKEPRCTPIQLGREIARERYGWGDSQFSALHNVYGTALWDRESSWDPCAHYPGVHGDCDYTGDAACGIPMRNPCNGLVQWSVRAQIVWGLDYIKGRYGTPWGALAHSHAVGWY